MACANAVPIVDLALVSCQVSWPRSVATACSITLRAESRANSDGVPYCHIVDQRVPPIRAATSRRAGSRQPSASSLHSEAGVGQIGIVDPIEKPAPSSSSSSAASVSRSHRSVFDPRYRFTHDARQGAGGFALFWR